MNQLRTHSFNEMIHLKYLSLSYMPNLSKIDGEAFSSLRNLTILKISHNPLLGYIDPEAFADFQYPMVLR